jgi:hypothetical protein
MLYMAQCTVHTAHPFLLMQILMEKGTFLSKLIKESDKHISVIKLLLYLCIFFYTLHARGHLGNATLRSMYDFPLPYFRFYLKYRKS